MHSHMSLPVHAREHPCTCACASMHVCAPEFTHAHHSASCAAHAFAYVHTEAMLTQLCMHQIESCMHESTCRIMSQFMHTCVQESDDDAILRDMLAEAVQQQEQQQEHEQQQESEEVWHEGEEEQEQEGR